MLRNRPGSTIRYTKAILPLYLKVSEIGRRSVKFSVDDFYSNFVLFYCNASVWVFSKYDSRNKSTYGK